MPSYSLPVRNETYMLLSKQTPFLMKILQIRLYLELELLSEFLYILEELLIVPFMIPSVGFFLFEAKLNCIKIMR